jgi:hypothetical protein
MTTITDATALPALIPAKLTLTGAAAATGIVAVIATLLAFTPSSGTGIGAVGAVFVVLYGADWVADFWVQTQHQADTKNAPGWRGWSALLLHVVTYTATAALGLAALAWRTDLELHAVNLLVGLAVYAITHGWADRRNTLAWLATATGSGRFYAVREHGINGALLLDRSWHIGWSAVVALLLV